VNVVSRFYEVLYSQKVRYGCVDTIGWSPSKRKVFDVKSYYQIMPNSVQYSFPCKSIWKVKAPPRVAFFVWTAALGKILTMDILCKRNIMVAEWCCMCKHGGESIDHLFLHCEVATEIWSGILQLFGIAWVMPRSVTECLGS
jgi:hypothetical protein